MDNSCESSVDEEYMDKILETCMLILNAFKYGHGEKCLDCKIYIVNYGILKEELDNEDADLENLYSKVLNILENVEKHIGVNTTQLKVIDQYMNLISRANHDSCPTCMLHKEYLESIKKYSSEINSQDINKEIEDAYLKIVKHTS